MVEEGRTRFHIRITPNAAQNSIQGWKDDTNGHRVLKVSVTALPERGKANEALIKLLSKTWKIPKSDIAIERGNTDRDKILSLPQKHSNLLL